MLQKLDLLKTCKKSRKPGRNLQKHLWQPRYYYLVIGRYAYKVWV